MSTSSAHEETRPTWELISVDIHELAEELAERAHPSRFTVDDGMAIAEHLTGLGLLRIGPFGLELAELEFEDYVDVVCEALGIVGFDY